MRTESTLPFSFRNDEARIQDRQARFRQFERRRRFALEQMEPRLLLSADDPLTSLQADAIKAGLSNLEGWADTLDTVALFTQQIPVVNRSITEALDIGEVFQSKFAGVVNGLGSTPTPAQIESALEVATPGLTVDVLTSATEITFTAVYGFDGTFETYMSLPGNDNAVVLDPAKESDLNFNKVTLNTHLDLNFTFGINLEGGLAASESFFIRVNDPDAGGPLTGFNAGMDFNAALPTLQANLGILDVSIAGAMSTFNLNADIGLTLVDPDNSDGLSHITLAELLGTSLGSLIPSPATTGTLAATLPISASLGASYTASASVGLSDTNLFDTTVPAFSFTGATNSIENFKNMNLRDAVVLLQQLGTSLQNVGEVLDPVGGIPFLEDTISDVADFTSFFSDFSGSFFDLVFKNADQYTAASEPSEDFRLEHDAMFQISTNEGVTFSTHTLLASSTTTNSSLNELIGDLNGVLPAGIVASDDGGLIKLSRAAGTFVLKYAGDNKGMKELGFVPVLANADFKYDSIQSFIARLDELLPLSSMQIGVDFDPTTKDLTFRIELDESFLSFERSVELDLSDVIDVDLGALSLTGHVEVDFAVEAALDMTIGFNLGPLGGTFELTNATLLSALNAGAGVQKVAGAGLKDFKVVRSDGTFFEIDLDDLPMNPTIGDLISHFNTVADGVPGRDVVLEIVPDDPATSVKENVALRVRETTPPAMGVLMVMRLNSSVAAQGLGILGADVVLDDNVAQIVGAPLHGDSFSKHAFVEEGATLSAHAEITAPTNSIDLFASLGIVEVGVKDGEGSILVDVDLVLNDPGMDPDDSRATFVELLEAPFHAVLSAADAGPSNGQLTTDAHFSIDLNGLGTPIAVTVMAADTSTNTSLSDLAKDIQTALGNTPVPAGAPYDGTVFEGENLGKFITVDTKDGKLLLTALVAKIQVTAMETDPAVTEMGFAPDQTSPESIIESGILTASGTLSLPLTFPGLEYLQLVAPTNASIELQFSSGSPIDFVANALNLPSTSDIANLVDFSSVDFFDLLQKIVALLQDPALDLLNEKLPLVDKSFNDLLAFTQPIEDALNEYLDKIADLKNELLLRLQGPLVDSADGTSLVPDSAINSIREVIMGTGLIAALEPAHPDQDIAMKFANALDALETAILSLPDSIGDPKLFDLPGRIVAAIGAFKAAMAAAAGVSLIGSMDAPANGQLSSDADFTVSVNDLTAIPIQVPVADATTLGFNNGQSATNLLTAANDLMDFDPGVNVTFTLFIGADGYIVKVLASATAMNADIAAMVLDINAALTSAIKVSDGSTTDISSLVTVVAAGNKLRFDAVDDTKVLAIGTLGATGDNTTIDDLVADIQTALNGRRFPTGGGYAGTDFEGRIVGNFVKVSRDGDRIVLRADADKLEVFISDSSDPMAAALGFSNGQTAVGLGTADEMLLEQVRSEFNEIKRSVPGVQQLAELLFDNLGLRDLITAEHLDTLKMDVLTALQDAADGIGVDTPERRAATDAFQLLHDRLKDVLDPVASIMDIAKLDLVELLDVFNDLSQAISDHAAVLPDNAMVDTDPIDLLNEALTGFSASFPGRLHFDFDSAEKLVTFGFDFDISASEEDIPMNFSLQDVPGVPDEMPVEVKTGGTLDIAVGAALTLDFGVDLDAAIADFFFLFPTTSLAFTALINATDITAEVSLGGIGAILAPNDDGKILLQKNIADMAVDDPASLTLSLSDASGDADNDDRVDLTELADWFDVDVEGAFQLDMDTEVFGVNLDPNLQITVPLATLFDIDTWTFQVPMIDFSLAKLDLVAIIKAIEAFLGFVGTSLESELLDKLPLVGDDLSIAGAKINQFKETVESIRMAIEANVTNTDGAGAVTEALQKLLFDTLGPGLPGSDMTPFNLGVTALDILKLNPAFHDSNTDGDNDNVGTPDTVTDYRDVDVMTSIDPMKNLVSDPNASVQFNLHIAGHEDFGTTFDLGFNAFNLVGISTEGGITLGVDYDVELGFKLDKPHGASLVLNSENASGVPDLPGAADPGPDPEVEAGVSVTLDDGTQLRLELFFLEITATNHDLDDPADADTLMTGFSGVATLDLDFSGTDVPILKLAEITPSPALTVAVEVDMRLDATVDGNKNLPSIRTDLLMDWMFTLDESGFNNTAPSLQFLNLGVDLGGFINDNIGPILMKINEILEPIRPLLDLLEFEVPIISQLTQLVGLGPFTFLDGISLLGEGGETVAKVLGILIEVDNFIAMATAIPNDIFIEFGDFDFSGQDLNLPELNIPENPLGALGDVLNSLDFTDALGMPTNADSTKGFLTSANDKEDSLGIDFPIVTDPSNILKLLMGQDADLITWDIPRLEAMFEFSQIFGPIVPPFPVYAKIGGGFGIFLDLFVGMDTRGIRTGNFLNSFYFGDFSDGPTGSEVPEAGITMELSAGAELNIAFAKAGVEGGIRAEITADWHDEASPGKVYLDEIIANLQRGILCVLDWSGKFAAFLGAYLEIVVPLGFSEITIIDVDFTIVEITLLDFTITCPPLPPPEPASVDGSTLFLNIGDRAEQRQPGATDGDDVITVWGEGDRNGDMMLSMTEDKNHDGMITEEELGEDIDNDGQVNPGVVAVIGFGQTRLFGRDSDAMLDESFFKSTTLVSMIVGNAGEGDDSITFDHVGIPGSLTGGEGDDEIVAGDANDTVAGDAGNDQIVGGKGNDNLSGNDGSDTIFGNAGSDTIDGGTADDVIYGGDNDNQDAGDAGDNITGGDGNDKIYGHLGNDVVSGGNGADYISGGPGNDSLAGDADNDTILGGEGTDTIDGGSGDDQLKGEAANDTIAGQSGDDYIEGGDADDTITGGSGNDKIIGGRSDAEAADPDGNDLIDGGSGNDIIIGGNGLIDAVTLIGGAGEDTIFGGTGNDLIYAQGGDDIAFGDDATPFLPGQSTYESSNTTAGGNDTIYGNNGSDVLVGGTASDRVFGGDDSSVDVLFGDNGKIVFTAGIITLIQSTAFDQGAADTLQAGAGDDVAVGGRGADSILGNEGEDVLVGDHGEVQYQSDGSILLIKAIGTSEGGNDTIQGHDGEDTILGGKGNDSITGNNADDIIHGDNAQLDYDSAGVLLMITSISVTDFGDDTITGFIGNDTVLGGSGNDDISGYSGQDILLGDNGKVTLVNVSGVPVVQKIESTDPDNGGKDTITGGLGDDTIVGGSGGGDISSAAPNDGDSLFGNEGVDIIVGDNATITRDTAVDVVTKIETTFPDKGGDDTIEGNAGDDTILGGYGSDNLYGNADDDVVLGDNGLMEWLSNGRFADIAGLADVIAEANAALFAKYSGAVADTDPLTLDLITTANPTLGGRDLIYGGDGKDFAFGGTDVDTIYGDDGNAADLPEGVGSVENKDLLFGDHGRIYPQFSAPGVDVNSRNFFSIHMSNADGGDGDLMWGEEGADLLLGGQGDDRMFGGSGDDDMIGGHNVAGGVDELTTPAIVATLNPPVNDVMDGGSGDDAMAGDNATIWRRSDDLSTRFRMLTAATIYTTTSDTITENVGATEQSDPEDSVGRDIRILDHSDTTLAGLFGSDVMAGNADNDTMFGELGNDLMQGDGFIGANDGDASTVTKSITFADSGMNPDTDETLYFNIPEAVTDRNDYMEGNGGSDEMYGNLGQDDMIGGNSDLFGLVSEVMRPDGSDVIFGGAGMDISRNNIGDATEDGTTHVITTLATGHARDADYIMGDNARIFRLVQGGASGTNPDDPADVFLTFAYDNYGTLKIIPRAMKQLDYTLGGADYAGGTYTSGAANADNGAADLIHGESGDDTIFGMTGSDVIFGEGQDDDIIGGYGNEWISGGTGQDGVVGDDGLIFTSRNGTAEPLYGLAATTQQTISTSGQIQYAIINVTGELKKSVELVPFSYDPDWDATDDEFVDNADHTPFADDAIFGGLGGDFLHGGSGDDAISGAEALDHAYVPTYDVMTGNPTGSILDLGYAAVGVPGNINPGDVLAFNPVDLDGGQQNASRAGEFDLYDEFDARRKVLLDSTGNLWKSAAQGASFEFLLNFNEDEGIVRPGGQVTGGGKPLQYDPVRDDGIDVLFGDNGNDWLVGGTGRDDMFGGWGNDLHNADDDHTTNGSLNDDPDTHPTYEDRAFGGAGRDVLLSNTGGDRLIDWVGEFNSYFVPFSPFGDPDVSRFLLPFLPDFLYALSKADGADQSQIRDFAGGVALRNGEPGGEIALILQSDDAWQDQEGGPADPQPGTIAGNARDVLWSADPNIPQGGPGQGLLVADPESPDASGPVPAITDDQLTATANAAIQQWSSILEPDQRSALNNLQFVLVGELPDDALAWNVGDGLTLVDRNAAGRGWFVDSTPGDSGEFRATGSALIATSGSTAAGRMDLLSTLIHEIGHGLGYEHSDGGPMDATLAAGERHQLIDWNADYTDLRALLGWNSTGKSQQPAFPEFTVGASKGKKKLLGDDGNEGDIAAAIETDWYVEV